MADREQVSSASKRALIALDTHYAYILGCTAADLRRPGWTMVPPRPEQDPVGMLFGRRLLLYLVAPASDAEARPSGQPGVAVIAPELREPVTALLRQVPPEVMFSARSLAAVDGLLRSLVPMALPERAQTHQYVHYTYPGAFQPYLGPWLDWIEPLDEAREMAPAALSLLARYSRGVYVVRQGGAIAAFAGIRAPSPHVWEIEAHTDAVPLRGHGLAHAVAARATRAVLAEGRVPLACHSAQSPAGSRLAIRLGYELYANALVYATTT